MRFKAFASLVVGLAIALTTTTAFSQPRQTQRVKFFCQNVQGVPTTFARTKRGNITRDIAIFRWVSTWSEFTPWQRCQEVSGRFQAFYDNGVLKYTRTGRINGYPVLCVVRETGGSCRNTDVLVTLPRGNDPHRTLEQIINFGSLSGRPINLSGSNLIFYNEGEAYVNMDALLNSDPVAGETN
ncbi:MAG: COP23 domain-containing protein [Phormidium sp.]